MYNLFLDDKRHPYDCINYMSMRLPSKHVAKYSQEKWVIVKDYQQFVEYIKLHGLPDIVSFDHDLADEHYAGYITHAQDWEDYYLNDSREMTGYDAAKWLCEYCTENNKKLPIYFIHTMNNVGHKNIQSYLNNYEKHNR